MAARAGQSVDVDPEQVRSFVRAWNAAAFAQALEPNRFGPLLTDPPDGWAFGLALGSRLLLDADPPHAAPCRPFIAVLETAISTAPAPDTGVSHGIDGH